MIVFVCEFEFVVLIDLFVFFEFLSVLIGVVVVFI